MRGRSTWRYLANLPGFVVMGAGDEAELVHMVATAAAYDEGPIAFRYPRGEGVGVEMPARGQVLEIGRGRVVREGTGVALLSFGAHLSECLKAAEDLGAAGVSVTVADARFAKPLDTDADRAARAAPRGADHGGAGGARAASARMCCTIWRMTAGSTAGCKVRTMTLADRFIDQASPEAMYADAGLTVGDIVATALKALGVASLGRVRA